MRYICNGQKLIVSVTSKKKVYEFKSTETAYATINKKKHIFFKECRFVIEFVGVDLYGRITIIISTF